MFLEVIPINSLSFMNFGELWENIKISSFLRCQNWQLQTASSNKFCKFHELKFPISKVRALSAFFCQKLKLLQTASNFTYMFLEVIPINSVSWSFMNFGELWEMSKVSSYFSKLLQVAHANKFWANLGDCQFHPFSKVSAFFCQKLKLLQTAPCSWRWFQ